MTRHRATTITLTLLALSAASPATAMAGSLLSGYGGPGAGSQAIIGSKLINSSTGGGSGGGARTSGGSSRTSTGTGPATPTTPSGSGAASGKRSHGHPATGKLPSASGEGSRSQKTYGLVAPQASVEGSPVLGVSGTDLLYIVLALGALLLTGAFTARLARPPR